MSKSLALDYAPDIFSHFYSGSTYVTRFLTKSLLKL